VLHDKADGITTFPASKTFVDFLGWGYRKGRGLFIVEGADSEVIGPPALELNKAAYDIQDIDAVLYFLYGILGNQFMEVNRRN
jgi:hypothetical protein